MNERYLFRGKVKDCGWAHGYICPDVLGENYVIQIFNNLDLFECECEVDPKTIGQCTGLKDKNEELIFEGDIVKRKCYTYKLGQRAPTGERIVIGNVYWSDNSSKEAGSWAISAFDEHGNPTDYILLAGFEITGNIHDNPELLEEINGNHSGCDIRA